MLWSRLRRRLEGEPNFRRQHPADPYILDFYCAEARLAVEIDGALHGEDQQFAHDVRRDRWLAERGIVVLRIPASSVYRDLDAAAQAVRVQAKAMAMERAVREDLAPSTIRSSPGLPPGSADGPPPPSGRGRQS